MSKFSFEDMSRDEDFLDDDKTIAYLGGQLRMGRLALVLGAGISMPFGLPNWPTLVRRLYEMSSERIPVDITNLALLAENYRSKVLANDDERYIRELTRSLYQNADISEATLLLNYQLAALGAIIISSARNSTAKVYTFNFDDLVENYLSLYGLSVHAVLDHSQWMGGCDVEVYHIHGYLPSRQGEQSSRGDRIVFDQRSFGDTVGKDHEPWRQMILSQLRQKTCLFIGLSGEDLNLDSYVQGIKVAHPANHGGTRYWGITFSDGNCETMKPIWQERGIHFRKVCSFDKDLPDFLLKICRSSAESHRF